MPTEAEFRAWEKETATDERNEQKEQTTQKRIVGVAMSQVKSDPRWKLYTDHLVGLRERLVEQAEHLANEILEDNTIDVTTKKMERHKLRGRIGGFSDAIQYIEVLIDQGEEAAKQLTQEEENENG